MVRDHAQFVDHGGSAGISVPFRAPGTAAIVRDQGRVLDHGSRGRDQPVEVPGSRGFLDHGGSAREGEERAGGEGLGAARLLAAEDASGLAGVAGGGAWPGELVRQLKQGIGGARHYVAGDVDHAAAATAGRASELLECLAGLDPVPFGEHADSLLDPDPEKTLR